MMSNRTSKNSKFIGVLTDESCDIAVLKKLIINVQTFSGGKVILVLLQTKVCLMVKQKLFSMRLMHG